jgi:hypothetical protein
MGLLYVIIQKHRVRISEEDQSSYAVAFLLDKKNLCLPHREKKRLREEREATIITVLVDGAMGSQFQRLQKSVVIFTFIFYVYR